MHNATTAEQHVEHVEVGQESSEVVATAQLLSPEQAAATVLDVTEPVALNRSSVATKNYKKGYLKIFLGYCAGVGKTFRMLQEAKINKNNGVDVVIGLVETHGRKETETLLQELEAVPRQTIHHGGIQITEMDLDAILLRRPQLVIVDELAHTNMPGLRHVKRYQDIEELLNAGINVYSTLNIQHVQSLIDIIQQITGVKVDEIIPDRILEIATEIELVDLPIEKLLQRLMEGKIYIPQKAKQAMQKFFKKGNLLALRELSLKYTAKRVDIDLLSYREQKEISNVWPVESKLLVGVNSGKMAEKLLLIAHRMATDLEADWYAVHVESPQQVHLSGKARTQLYRNIHLAEELGAKVVTLSGNLIADEIVKFARQKNVTLIIAGLSRRSRIDEMFKGSVLNRLVKKSSPINVLVVGNENDEPLPSPYTQSKIEYKPYFFSVLIITLITLIGGFLAPHANPLDVLMLLFLPVMVIGFLWGNNVNLFASLFSVAMVDFFFVPPYFSFAIGNLKCLYSFTIFIVVATVINLLGRFVRWRTKSAHYRERFISALYSFSHEMMMAESLDDILQRVVRNIYEAFETDVIILLPNKFGELEATAKNKQDLTLSEAERAVAIWVYKNGLPAGRGSSTLSSAKWYYLPLKINENTIGVICMIKVDIDKHFTPEQKRLLESFASIVTMALTKLGHYDPDINISG